MVRVAMCGKRCTLLGTAALLLSASGFAEPVVDPITDCERKPVEEVYGSYVHDKPRLRPVPGSWLSVKETYGDYEQVEMSQDWMYLSETKAYAYAGLKVSIEPNRFQAGGTEIINPQYVVACYRTFVEGHVPVYRWSNEQGFGSDRAVIHVLRVYRPEDKDRRAPKIFEMVGNDLWMTTSGWLFVIRRRE